VRHHLFFSISHTHLIFINKDTIYNDNNPLSSLARDRRMKKKKDAKSGSVALKEPRNIYNSNNKADKLVFCLVESKRKTSASQKTKRTPCLIGYLDFFVYMVRFFNFLFQFNN